MFAAIKRKVHRAAEQSEPEKLARYLNDAMKEIREQEAELDRLRKNAAGMAMQVMRDLDITSIVDAHGRTILLVRPYQKTSYETAGLKFEAGLDPDFAAKLEPYERVSQVGAHVRFP